MAKKTNKSGELYHMNNKIEKLTTELFEECKKQNVAILLAVKDGKEVINGACGSCADMSQMHITNEFELIKESKFSDIDEIRKVAFISSVINNEEDFIDAMTRIATGGF